MKMKLKLKRRFVLGILFLLTGAAVFAQDLSDTEIGFDPVKAASRLKERGVSDQDMSREIMILRDQYVSMYRSMKKQQEDLLKKIEAEQRSLVTDRSFEFDIPAAEKEALRAFYNAANGPSWSDNTGWNFNTPVTSWDNNTKTGWYGITVSNNHVTAIELSNNRLRNGSNAIADLSALSSLMVLNLMANYLSGSMDAFHKITSLRSLNLGGCLFSDAEIPVSFQNLSNLSVLSLDNLHLSQMSDFVFIGSHFSNLQTLSLNGNQYTGALPDEFGNMNRQLEVLYISSNKITDITALGNIPSLRQIWSIQNNITSIPSSFSNLNLTDLSLSFNKLTGSIPALFANHSRLRILLLNNNFLEGKIPNLSALPSLRTFNVSQNKFRFADFAAEYPLYKNKSGSPNYLSFAYDQQAKVDTEGTKNASIGGSVTLTMYEDGSYTADDTCQWYKNGTLIPGAVNRTYTLSNLKTTDNGTYFCRSQNSKITNPGKNFQNLVLEREPITVNVSSGTETDNTDTDSAESGSEFSSDENYIITRLYKEPSTALFTNPSQDKAQTNITYFDGLGRPVQQIANRQSGTGKDLITPIGYDDFGRQIREYLPYGAASTNMAYEPSAVSNALAFYNTDTYENTADPYSEKKFEPSPLNRVLKQAAPGNDWAMDAGHEIKLDYQSNTGGEVRLFEASAVWRSDLGLYDTALAENGTYPVGALYKTITYDENTAPGAGVGTEEFKNKEGQVVLKRSWESQQRQDTYYVYDNYGNLAYVVPPKADGAVTADVLNKLCYQYKYDNRNRLVEKKLPGKQWEFILYDKLDRPAASGPVFSPFKEDKTQGWIIIKYDAFNRPVYTGWLGAACNAQTRKTMQDAQNAASVLSETRQNSGTIDGIAVNYSSVTSPGGFKLLSINYYDNYTYPGAQPQPSAIEGQTVLADVKGLSTGSWTRACKTALETRGETTSIFYDSKARPVRTYTQNYLGGYTAVDSRLNFIGKSLYTITRHKLSQNKAELTIREEFTYSPQDRLLTHIHQINGGQTELLAKNTYDELGRLKDKSVGNNTASPLQKVDYKYNIRGWLTQINKTAGLEQDADPRDLFAFKINYNKVDYITNAVKKLYNGNIAEAIWTTGNDVTGVVRCYGYQYDELGRLKEAVYQTPSLTDNKNYFGESLNYDKNGNITGLQRKFMAGVLSNPYAGDMDILSYFYADNSNKLKKVTDASNSPQGFKDDSTGYNDTSDDYTYDDNGNLIKDENKNITEIVYNQLNLPKKITFGTGNTIEYLYNSSGQKLEKTVIENGRQTNTKYQGGFQYKNDILEFFPTAEGYVRNTSTNPAVSVFQYVYNYTDHLGNIRVSYARNPVTNKAEILEENNYYPFGLKHEGYNSLVTSTNQASKYKYNSKELQDELGLNMYDYGARNYDPALGRWMNIDPLAEKSRRFSPYTYALNNPVYFIDPDGMEVMSPIYGSQGQFLGTDSQGFKGEVIFMQESTFALFGGQGMDHNTALQVGNTIDQVVGDNPSETFTQGEINMVNNAITDVVSRTSGYESAFTKGFTPFSKDLHNGKTSSSFWSQRLGDGTGGAWKESNDAINMGRSIMANTGEDTNGKSLISYNIAEFNGNSFTVENIQNTWVHEFGNHYLKDIPGGGGEAHAKAIYNQSLHPTWKDATNGFKTNMRNIYEEYTGRKLNR